MFDAAVVAAKPEKFIPDALARLLPDQLYGRLLCSLGGGDGLSLVRACYRGVPNLVDLICAKCTPAESAEIASLLKTLDSEESAESLS